MWCQSHAEPSTGRLAQPKNPAEQAAVKSGKCVFIVSTSLVKKVMGIATQRHRRAELRTGRLNGRHPSSYLRFFHKRETAGNNVQHVYRCPRSGTS
jgi:hypothetical protein